MTDPQKQPTPPREQLLAPRPLVIGALVSLLGWLVVIIPMIAMAALIFAMVMKPGSSLISISKIALILLCVALLFCMISAPHFLGQAVIHRERAMWRAALVTGIPTLGVIIFVVIRWLTNS